VDCIVLQPQRADEPTKAWLASHADDAPPTADGFFKRVADNSEKFERYCLGIPASAAPRPDQVGAVP